MEKPLKLGAKNPLKLQFLPSKFSPHFFSFSNIPFSLLFLSLFSYLILSDILWLWINTFPSTFAPKVSLLEENHEKKSPSFWEKKSTKGRNWRQNQRERERERNRGEKRQKSGGEKGRKEEVRLIHQTQSPVTVPFYVSPSLPPFLSIYLSLILSLFPSFFPTGDSRIVFVWLEHLFSTMLTDYY